MKKWKMENLMFQKKMFFLFGILLLISLISARPLTCADNPIALWHFDEGSGSVVTDSCNGMNGITGILYGTNITWIDGKYDSSILFNGYDNYVDIGSQINQSFNDFSIMAWVKVNEKDTDYQTFIGREIPYGDWVWNFALAKDSINTGYPDVSYFNIFDINNGIQNVVGTYFYPQYNLTDENWHLLIGTFNSTDGIMSLYFDGNLVESIPTILSSIPASSDYFFFGTSFNSEINNLRYFLNGSLDDVAIFDRTLSQEEITDYYSDTPLNFTCYNNLQQQLNTISYPYVELGNNYPMQYFIYSNNTFFYIGNVSMNIMELDGNISGFNLNWNYVASSYDLTLLFMQEGNYPFTIYSSSCPNINNFTGIFLVRKSFDITICGFENKTGSKYENNFAYLTAELTSARNFRYDTNIETFISPFYNQQILRLPVFHTYYSDGCGTLRLYEKDESYALRIRDGEIIFPYTYSQPNITKSYGTNIYLGKFYFNGSNQAFDIYLSEKELTPYKWLFNWSFIILLIGLTFLSGVLFFMIPDKPQVALSLGLGGSIMLIIVRIAIWVWRY